MIIYSEKWCKMFLAQNWLQDFNLVSDKDFDASRLEQLTKQAICGFLIKDKTDRKRIPLPSSAYLALSEEEKRMHAKYETALLQSHLFDDRRVPKRINEVLCGSMLHDSDILKIAVRGSVVDLVLCIDGGVNGNLPYRLLRFEGARLLLSDIKEVIDLRMDENLQVSSNFMLVFNEVCSCNDHFQCHIAFDKWRRLGSIVIDFERVNLHPCTVSLNRDRLIYEVGKPVS